MKVTLDNLEIPRGFESIGEYRQPRKGETYLNPCTTATVSALDDYSSRRIILRKTWQPPSWLPNGYWVYKASPMLGSWRVCRTEPIKDGAGHDYGVNSISVYILASFYGDEEFVPPTYSTKIQVIR